LCACAEIQGRFFATLKQHQTHRMDIKCTGPQLRTQERIWEIKPNRENRNKKMKILKQILLGGMLAAAVMAAASSAVAQIQTTGTPGSPSAT